MTKLRYIVDANLTGLIGELDVKNGETKNGCWCEDLSIWFMISGSVY